MRAAVLITKGAINYCSTYNNERTVYLVIFLSVTLQTKSTTLILLFVHGNGTELFNRLSKCITTKKTKITYLCLNPNIIVTKHKYFILCYVTVGKGDIKVSGLCEIVALQLLV